MIYDTTSTVTVGNGMIGYVDTGVGTGYYTPWPQYASQCWYCGVWYSGAHYHTSPVTLIESPRYSCGTADHDYTQIKGSRALTPGGKVRLFCRRCGTTKEV